MHEHPESDLERRLAGLLVPAGWGRRVVAEAIDDEHAGDARGAALGLLWIAAALALAIGLTLLTTPAERSRGGMESDRHATVAYTLSNQDGLLVLARENGEVISIQGGK